MGLGNSTACQFSSNIASLCGLTTVSGPRNIIITIYIPYSRKFSLDKECCPTRLPLYCKYILSGINFCPCGKGHHRFCVIINKKFWDKNFAHESWGQKRRTFQAILVLLVYMYIYDITVFCLQGTTEEAVASVLELTQDSAAVVDPNAVTIAITILSQNTSALQNDMVIELPHLITRCMCKVITKIIGSRDLGV